MLLLQFQRAARLPADGQSVVFRTISSPNFGTPINSRSPIRIASPLTNQPFFIFRSRVDAAPSFFLTAFLTAPLIA
jgi:hypothetical protein